MHTVETKLNIYFALIACLCGLTFAGVPEVGALPLIAIFFALFGLFFVDLLKWFSLPPTMAYVALGAIAFYTLNRYLTIGTTSAEPQMVAVAELLVLVQAVLMLQRKSRRIYEQLAVFALLELIVAAIFNNALSYGLLLLPLCVAALGALSLLHVYSVSEGAFSQRALADSSLRVSSGESQRSYVTTAETLPQIGIATIAPATLLVAFVFFYALPRTNQEANRGLGGQAQVGFNEKVSLGQIGPMLLNPEVAAKVYIADRRSRSRYDVRGDFYLRGAVLEQYNPDLEKTGTWGTASSDDSMMAPRQLPAPPLEPRGSDRLANDDLTVKIDLSPMRGTSLFSLPPYHFDASGPDIVHLSDRWVIQRAKTPVTSRNSQISYRFATRAFRDGVQRRYLPRFSAQRFSVSIDGADDASGMAIGDPASATNQSAEAASNDERPAADSDAALARPDQLISAATTREEARLFAESHRRAHELSAINYVDACLGYDIDAVPSAERLAESISAQRVKDRNNPVETALALERYLAAGVDYQYTLDLSMTQTIGMDPIQQFLSVDRRGNCQYFASALVLMLRSQGIPARLVVGFNTDEYNNIGGYYIARQLHAHAWVEALVDAKWLQPNELTYSATPPTQYWMHLDPTPGGGGTHVAAGGRVSNVLDLAQDIWTSYVVEADAGDRRRESGIGTDGMTSSYAMFYERMKLSLSRIRAGELGAGALAGRERFSWISALIGIGVFLLGLVAYQWSLHRWLLGDKTTKHAQPIAKPSIAFFAEAVAMLERLGILRRLGQTPKEYMTGAAFTLDRQQSASIAGPLNDLTSAYYLQRFGTDAGQVSEGSGENQTRRVELALDRIRARIDEESHLKEISPEGKMNALR